MAKTIREQVRDNINDHVMEMLRKSHECNYETLYVESSGDLWWSEEVDSNTYQARDGREIPSLAKVGTGSTPCNCDRCQGPNAVESSSEIDFDADEMERKLDEIEIGYFDDEDAE